MKLAISNIAWNSELDRNILPLLSDKGFSAIEIAPTRIVREEPYRKENLIKSIDIVNDIFKTSNLSVCSMQSIFYGRSENIFGKDEERVRIFDYFKAAIDYASSISCGHLVFGCPKNRIMLTGDQFNIAADFFIESANYARSKGVVIGLEANPDIYGTNFINKTEDAYNFISELNHPSLRINLDLGTILINKENIKDIHKYISLVSHVHISEPFLEPISRRSEHKLLKEVLDYCEYSKFISVEMNYSGEDALYSSIDYISSIFHR